MKKYLLLTALIAISFPFLETQAEHSPDNEGYLDVRVLGNSNKQIKFKIGDYDTKYKYKLKLSYKFPRGTTPCTSSYYFLHNSSNCWKILRKERIISKLNDSSGELTRTFLEKNIFYNFWLPLPPPPSNDVPSPPNFDRPHSPWINPYTIRRTSESDKPNTELKNPNVLRNLNNEDTLEIDAAKLRHTNPDKRISSNYYSNSVIFDKEIIPNNTYKLNLYNLKDVFFTNECLYIIKHFPSLISNIKPLTIVRLSLIAYESDEDNDDAGDDDPDDGDDDPDDDDDDDNIVKRTKIFPLIYNGQSFFISHNTADELWLKANRKDVIFDGKSYTVISLPEINAETGTLISSSPDGTYPYIDLEVGETAEFNYFINTNLNVPGGSLSGDPIFLQITEFDEDGNIINSVNDYNMGNDTGNNSSLRLLNGKVQFRLSSKTYKYQFSIYYQDRILRNQCIPSSPAQNALITISR